MDNKPDLINKITWDGIDVTFKIYLTKDFDHLTNITQEYALVLNERNEILLVSAKDMVWQLPGGGVEPDENRIDTLIRELDEEAAIVPDPNSVKPFFYQDVYWHEDGTEVFKGSQVRYICKPKTIKRFEADPDRGHIVNHQWTKLEDLDTYLKWGPTAGFIQKHLPNYL